MTDSSRSCNNKDQNHDTGTLAKPLPCLVTTAPVGSLWQRLWPDEWTGKFTLTRLRAFHKYRQTRPLWWKLLVIVVTPVPPILVVASLNWLPLARPSNGWQANYMLFVRMFVESHVCMQCVKKQREFFFAREPTRLQHGWLLRNVAALFCTTMLFVFSAKIAFPMPFGLLIALLLTGPFMFGFLRFGVKRIKRPESPLSKRYQPRRVSRVHVSIGHGNGTGTESPHLVSSEMVPFKVRLQEFTRMFLFNMSLVFIFPIYQVGYSKLDGHDAIQLVYFLMLPTLLRKLLVIWHRHHCKFMPDVSNEAIVFSVKFSVSLFKCVFLGMSGWLRTLLVMLWDCGELGFCLVQIARDSREVHEFVGQNGPHCSVTEDFVAHHVRYLALHRSKVVEKAKDNQLQEDGVIHEAVYATDTYSTLRRQLSYCPSSSFSVVKVVHGSLEKGPHPQSITEPKADRELCRNMQLLDKTLAAMFALEYIVLLEFVEVLIPLLYVCYMELSFYSPCQPFLRHVLHLDDASVHQTVVSMVAYGTAELASFLVLCFVVNQRFGLNAIDLLAFVLEIHFGNIQAKMILFLVIVLAFELVHYGVDFSFQFDV